MNRFRNIRLRLGVTQAEMARGLGCTQGNVGHYEARGQTVPPDVAKSLIVYARARGHVVTFDEIYGPADGEPVDTKPAEQGVANA